MTTLSVALSGLQTLISDLAGRAETPTPVQDTVTNRDVAAPAYPAIDGPGIEVTVAITQITSDGRDEICTVYDAGTDVFRVSGRGHRHVDVQVLVEAVHVEDWPLAVAENIRSRMGLPSSRDALAALGFALRSIGSVTDSSAVSDGRVIPAATLTFDLNFSVSYSDTDQVTIDTVNFTGPV